MCSAAFAQQPRIDGISPAQGPIAGGTIVTINGANFASATVTLDGAGIPPLSQTDAQVRLQMPAHDNGYALLQIGSAAAEFLYVPPKLEDLPPGYITTVAGIGNYLRLEQPATKSPLSPWGLAAAPNGDIFAVGDRNLIFRISADGILHRAAGTLGPANFQFLGDGGPALDAFIGFPRDVARDAAGNLYVNDSARCRIRRIDPGGMITTIAGTGNKAFSGDGGPAAKADLLEPTHLTCAPDGTIYFLDGNVRVRKITPGGVISTVAGNGMVGDSGDGGPATQAQLDVGVNDLGQVALDGDGNLFILEFDGKRVRRVDASSGVINTFVSTDGIYFGRVRALAIDPSGNVYIGSPAGFDKFDRSARLVESWGTGSGFSEDGTLAKDARFGDPKAMMIASNGDIVYSEESPRRLRKINLASGKLETIAGIGPEPLGVPGSAAGALFTSPSGDLAFLPSGDLIFADAEANWMFRMDMRSGTLTKLAGTGMFIGAYEETPALGANVSTPSGLAVLSDGTVYFSDKLTIRSIDNGGIVHRVAGVKGNCDFAGDGGPALTALLCQPQDVKLDGAGNLFIVDTNNNRIRRVDGGSGIITTVAGSGPSNGLEGYGHGSRCGDGGPALSACFNSPIAVAVRNDGTMYINDFYNVPRIRKITPDGIVSSLDWLQPFKLIVGPDQSIFVHGVNRIYRADNDRVRLIAGNGVSGFSGDGGPALQAMLAPGEAELAQGLAIDADGNLFFHDAGNRRIRAVRFGAVLAPPNAAIQATASGSTIRVAVFDFDGHSAPGVRVDLTAPASGPSCRFPNGMSTIGVVTDATGVATTSCVPNCDGNGSFAVTAQPLTATATAHVTMSDIAGPCRRRAVRH
ncbi:MAG TPA: IPT/TIG domain-containing protein [Thermoanaerobaculia bacterium]|nr:IPT/TIG domain-containing protein [Thermoanaerobaculia bacterium]